VSNVPPALRAFRYRRVAEIAADQCGVVSARQLEACGLSESTIDRWHKKGILHRRHRGVYAFGAPSNTPEQQWAAALVAAGDGARLSRVASLALYGLWTPPRVTHVVADRRRRGDATLRVHTTTRAEITRHRGFPTTPLPRTFLDLAADHFPINRVVHEAAARRLIELTALRDYAHEHRGRPGAKALTTAATNPHYRSRAETNLHGALTRLGVLAHPNTKLAGHTVDFHLPDHDLVIELDFDQTHGTTHAARKDAQRDADLQRHGLHVLRIDGDAR
jgi:hypothetical protein